MTCIVGIVKDGKVFMGGDSCVSFNGENSRQKISKVFIRDDILFGISGYAALSNALQYRLDIPDQSKKEDDEKYLNTKFIDAIKKSLDFYDDKIYEAIHFIFGYKGRLYHCDTSMCISECPERGFSIGSGAHNANAILEHLKDDDSPEDTIMTALKITGELNLYVDGPYKVLEK